MFKELSRFFVIAESLMLSKVSAGFVFVNRSLVELVNSFSKLLLAMQAGVKNHDLV